MRGLGAWGSRGHCASRDARLLAQPSPRKKEPPRFLGHCAQNWDILWEGILPK